MRTDRADKAKTAVVCDDDPVTRKLVTRLLEHVGFAVAAETATAGDALAAAATYQPDVLVLDLVLPGESGDDALPAIRAAAPECAIVVFSEFDPRSGLRAGTRLVHKGNVEELEALLASLVTLPATWATGA